MTGNRKAKRIQESVLRKTGQWLTTIEAAEYIDRHRSTLDQWRAENIVLPYYRDGKKIMYAIEDLDNYLASRRVEPVAYTAPSRQPIEEPTQSCPKVIQNDPWAA